MFTCCVLFIVLLAEASAARTCKIDELPCSNGTMCIAQHLWCDGEYDCPDGSDEYSCPDKSQLAVVKAARYFLRERKSDYGWDDFTPRALIALTFAEKYLQIPEEEKFSMKKRLNLQLLLLLQNGIENLASLALHINALYAMCEDPRDFHGNDLVALLRSETDKKMKSDFKLATVLLTLCLAKEERQNDLYMLNKIYAENKDRIGVQALAVVAMTVCNTFSASDRPYDIGQHFSQHCCTDCFGTSVDVYSKALIYQACNALGIDTSPFHHELLKLQSVDDSFGDLLGTYSAIPALLGTSLANLKCKTRNYKAKPAKLSFSVTEKMLPEKHVDISLWIQDGENNGYHNLRITFEGNKSLYDLLKMAAQRNPMYRFKYDEMREVGKIVYYLAGIPNDAEKGLIWTLYRELPNNVKANSTKGVQKETNGVDRVYPEEGSHFIFQLEHYKL